VRGLVPRHENRQANRHRQDGDDDGEWDVIRDRKQLWQNHFDSDKHQNEGEAAPKIDEASHQIGEQEIEGTQSNDRANIWGIHNEGVLRDSEYRRDWIDREDKVHDIDHEQNQSERSKH